jgi:hypothetical protein
MLPEKQKEILSKPARDKSAGCAGRLHDAKSVLMFWQAWYFIFAAVADGV